MKLEYDDITIEQWELFRAIERACFKEDLKMVLEEDYNKNINEFSDEQIELVFERYEDYRNDGEWREDMHFAINRELDI